MKKLFLWPAIFLALFLIFLPTRANAWPQPCVQDGRSCDANNVCCSFPNYLCQGGYCKPAPSQCGKDSVQCCATPNPECDAGLVCINNACYDTSNCGTLNKPCCVPPKSPCQGNLSCTGTPGTGSSAYCAAPPPSPTPTPPCGNFGNFCCQAPTPPCNNNVPCYNGRCQVPPSPRPLVPTPTLGVSLPNLFCPGGVTTALGCIPTTSTNFVAWILARAMGLGGGIAFLLMIGGAIQLLTSSGNPEGIKKGGETITSALMGLLFIIFSLFLLHLIGVDILKIPGFSK